MRMTSDPSDPAYRHAMMMGVHPGFVDIVLDGLRVNDKYAVVMADEEQGEVRVVLTEPATHQFIIDPETGKPVTHVLYGDVKIIPVFDRKTGIWPHSGLFMFPVTKEHAQKVLY